MTRPSEWGLGWKHLYGSLPSSPSRRNDTLGPFRAGRDPGRGRADDPITLTPNQLPTRGRDLVSPSSLEGVPTLTPCSSPTRDGFATTGTQRRTRVPQGQKRDRTTTLGDSVSDRVSPPNPGPPPRGGPIHRPSPTRPFRSTPDRWTGSDVGGSRGGEWEEIQRYSDENSDRPDDI